MTVGYFLTLQFSFRRVFATNPEHPRGQASAIPPRPLAERASGHSGQPRVRARLLSHLKRQDIHQLLRHGAVTARQ